MFNVNFKTYWYLRNDGSPVMKRRRFFIWSDYERFTDREYKLQAEINKLHDKLVDKCHEYDQLQQEKDQVVISINQAGDRQKGKGPMIWKKMSLFSGNKKRILEPDAKDWEDCLAWVFQTTRGFGKTLADTISGVSIKGANFPVVIDSESEIIGTSEHNMRPHNRNQKGKNRGNNNNNNQQ